MKTSIKTCLSSREGSCRQRRDSVYTSQSKRERNWTYDELINLPKTHPLPPDIPIFRKTEPFHLSTQKINNPAPGHRVVHLLRPSPTPPPPGSPILEEDEKNSPLGTWANVRPIPPSDSSKVYAGLFRVAVEMSPRSQSELTLLRWGPACGVSWILMREDRERPAADHGALLSSPGQRRGAEEGEEEEEGEAERARAASTPRGSEREGGGCLHPGTTEGGGRRRVTRRLWRERTETEGRRRDRQKERNRFSLLFSSLPFPSARVCVTLQRRRQEVEDERMSRRRRRRKRSLRGCRRGREGGSGGGHVGDVQYCSNDAEPTPLATIFSLYTF